MKTRQEHAIHEKDRRHDQRIAADTTVRTWRLADSNRHGPAWHLPPSTPGCTLTPCGYPERSTGTEAEIHGLPSMHDGSRVCGICRRIAARKPQEVRTVNRVRSWKVSAR